MRSFQSIFCMVKRNERNLAAMMSSGQIARFLANQHAPTVWDNAIQSGTLEQMIFWNWPGESSYFFRRIDALSCSRKSNNSTGTRSFFVTQLFRTQH
jgi:hypothetical protein